MAGALTSISGRVPSLETELGRRIASDQAGDPLTPVAVLIGGSLQRPYLQRRVATLNGGILNVHFLMASELALKLGQRAMIAAGRSPLPALGDRVLLGRIAGEQEGYFEPVRHASGFADALHRTIREIRQAGVAPAELRASLDGACEVPEKADALSDIYERFLDARSDFYGPDDCLLAADVEAAPWTALHVVGLTDPPAALDRLLRELAKRIDVSIYLPEYGTEADEATAAFRDRLVRAGVEQIAIEPPDDPGSGLAHVQTNLFGSPEAGPTDDSLQLLSAPDPVREVREIARACLRWADQGFAFHEMAIVYRHADTYRAVIESVFNEAGIPLYLHEGSPLIERPLGRRIVALLGLTEKRFDRRSVIDFLADAHLPKETSERYDSFNPSLWDRISRDAGVVEGKEQWSQRLNALIVDLEGREEADRWERDLAAARDLLAFVTELFERIEALPQVATWPEHLGAFGFLLDTYVRDVEPVVDALDGLHRIGALESEVSDERFRELVTSALEGMRDDDVRSGRAGAFGRRGVNVLDVNSLRLLRFRAVALVGLTERDFPSPPSPDPLLLDQERIAFNGRSPSPLPLRVLGPDPEPLQLTLAVEAGGERLLASYPRKASGDGNAQLPSIFFRAIAEAAVGHPVAADDVDGLPPELFTRAKGSRIGANDIDLAISLAERDRTLIEQQAAVGRGVLLTTTPRMNGAFEQRRAQLSNKLTAFDGVLPVNVAAMRGDFFPDDRQLSPSALETYASCPQRFFLGNFLRLSKIKEPESVITISPLDKGTLIHRILERFLGEDPPAGEKVFGEGEPARLAGIAAEEFAACEDKGLTGYGLTWTYVKEEILEDLQRWLGEERDDELSAAMPEGDYETRFGHPWRRGEDEGRLSSDEQLEIPIDGDGVPLHLGGRIDRLSWNPDRTTFRVIDYKTGGTYKDPGDGRLKGGQALQLPIYLLAGARILGIDLTAGGRGSAEYHYPTRKGGFHRSSFSTEDLNDREAELDQILAAIVGGIRSGIFQMNPKSDRDCGFCDFDLICPTARHQQIERKAGDKAAKPFQRMREIK